MEGEEVVAWFKVSLLHQHLIVGNEENHEDLVNKAGFRARNWEFVHNLFGFGEQPKQYESWLIWENIVKFHGRNIQRCSKRYMSIHKPKSRCSEL
jgi:hypothetical protein